MYHYNKWTDSHYFTKGPLEIQKHTNAIQVIITTWFGDICIFVAKRAIHIEIL